MSDCICPSPQPTPSCVPYTEQIFSPAIGYYMGEHIGLKSSFNKFGVLDELYIAFEPTTTAPYGWSIPDYNCQDLIDAEILPAITLNNSGVRTIPYVNDPISTTITTIQQAAFDTFTLTEAEILASNNFETWKSFGARWLSDEATYEPPQPGIKPFMKSINLINAPLIVKTWNALGYAIDEWDLMRNILSSVNHSAKNGDLSGLGGRLASEAIMPEIRQSLPDKESIEAKLESVHQWIKNIADSYYGKTFLVRIGNDTPMEYIDDPGSGHQKWRGICIKDKDGNYPKAKKSGGLGSIFFIDGDGEGQGYSVTDQPCPDGGFPSDRINADSILGLSGNELDWTKTEDGRVSCFVKVGRVVESKKVKLYSKYNDNFFIDFTKLNIDNYYLKSDTNQDNIDLYIKANVEDRIYNITGQAKSTYQPSAGSPGKTGQWVLIKLSEQIPLTIDIENTWREMLQALRVVAAKTDPNISQFQQYLQDFLHVKANLDDAINGIISKYRFGARNNISQANILRINSLSIIPSGCVIPMKSNIYRYGPYYYDGSISSPTQTNKPDNSGGVDVVNHEILVPWNFYEPLSSPSPIAKAYDTMDCVGAELAKDASKGLQRVERGKITIAGLPSVPKLGYSVDTATRFPDGDGPTLLTDINVEYGNGGFRSTYNFQSHTQRFGQTEKHILNAWTEAIKKNQAAYEYIKSQRQRINNIAARNIQDTSIKNLQSNSTITPIHTKKFSPNKLLISGYYFNPSSTTNYDDSPDSPSSSLSSSPYPTDAPFDPCDQPGPIPSTSSSPAPNSDRIYAFAETYEAYQTLHMQATYRQLHIMSIDGLYLPVSLKGDIIPSPSPSHNSGRIARFSMRQENNGNFVEWKDSSNIFYDKFTPGFSNPSKTRDEIPPFKVIGISSPKVYSLPINQQYLNPMLSSKLLEDWDERKNNTGKGFVISSIAFGVDPHKFQITHNDLGKGPNDSILPGDDEILRQEQDNFRFSAIRGPLVVQGWGYDTTGKPIPNSADTAYKAERGQFTKFNLTDKFMTGWIENPRVWPVGPVDLRFDRERGVWTCPSPNKIVVARLKDKLRPFKKARAQLLNPESDGLRFYQNYNLSGPNGEDIKLHLKNTIIMVYDFLGVELYANDVIYAYYDDNRYIVLESNRNYKDSDQDQKYKDFDQYPETCTTTTTTTPTPTTPPCDWCGLECLKELPSYNGDVKQILGHDNKGCLIWYNITKCEEECVCCNLNNGNPLVFAFDGLASNPDRVLFDPAPLDNCPYSSPPPGAPPSPVTGGNGAMGIFAQLVNNKWIFTIQFYCSDSQATIKVDGGSDGEFFTGPPNTGLLLSGNGYQLPIIDTDGVECLDGVTVDITIDGNSNLTAVFIV